jgi:lipopolysaccharide/colanic/teichoic acid biosynthesis glycosyltransferase
MVKRLFDILTAFVGLFALAPICCVAAVGIRLSSPGPIFFRTKRAGVRNHLFTMYKFRTMHVNHGQFANAITGLRDPRVFPFGSLLRRLKIDELPQLLNVLKGEMSIVGPRPEDPRIVNQHFRPEHFATLNARPGLASPGSIYNYTHGERLLQGDDPERVYVERLLATKLALDLIYVNEASLYYDLRIIFRAIWTIVAMALGKQHFAEPPELQKVSSDQLLNLFPPMSQV